MADAGVRIGVIGGSGLYEMAALADREEVAVSTPFGEPSAPVVVGTLSDQRVAFLSRHGMGHRLLPSELNFRANIYALKTLGVEWVISASAVGSLQEQYRPLDIVVPDQFLDRTRGRISTFFGDGIVGRTSPSRTRCAALSASSSKSRPTRRMRPCTGEGPMCAWRGRSSRRGPSHDSTAPGAWT